MRTSKASNSGTLRILDVVLASGPGAEKGSRAELSQGVCTLRFECSCFLVMTYFLLRD